MSTPPAPQHRADLISLSAHAHVPRQRRRNAIDGVDKALMSCLFSRRNGCGRNNRADTGFALQRKINFHSNGRLLTIRQNTKTHSLFGGTPRCG